MKRAGFALLLGLTALLGCHSRELASPTRPAAPQLVLTPRGTIEPGVSTISTDPTTPKPRPTQYRLLHADDCRAFAIQNAPLADDLDSHPANEPPTHHLALKSSESAYLSRLVRGYAADELRNRAAGDALDDYYKLAAAEGQYDLALESHRILTKQLSDAEKAVQQGLKDRGDVPALRRQLLELESKAAKLDGGMGALNASLVGRLGLDPANPLPLWPYEALRASPETPDVERAVATALQCRPDLNLIRTLAFAETADGGLTNAVLNSVNPLLGNTDSSHPLAALVALVKKHETQIEARTRQQLLGALSARERQAEAEVRAAVATHTGNRLSAAAKAAEVRNLLTRVSELEKREAAGQQVTLELTTARLDLLRVRGELVQAVADWHIADVRLRQAMGLLVRE